MEKWQPAGTPSPVADFISRQASRGVSSLHVVGTQCADALASFLSSRGVATLHRVLAERKFVSGEWLAEHAQAQLGPGSGCESTPAWVVWISPSREEPEHYVMALWAEDGRAARRALLALKLEHAMVVHVKALPRTMRSQLERWAYDQGDAELVEDVPGGESSSLAVPSALDAQALEHNECSAVLVRREGEELEKLIQTRRNASAEDEEAAMGRLHEFSRRLLQIDPKAEIDVAPAITTAARGKLSVLAVRMNGHVMSWGGEIDRYTNVDELVRLACTSCQCC
ncbi:hypothetical protein AB1Y20_015784 [Prymnesium parvum]|uniref:Uncharacterized protein n=1 Tax=Prymnesium parvum TaxID=97485 RepID=A0AB34K2G7_PRYPA